MAPPLSIVIATHNRYEDVCACIDALAEQPAVRSCEVIVVDSASGEECRKRMEKLIKQTGFAALHRVDEPGVSRARNLGARISTAPWFATLDDDAIPQNSWVDNALEICFNVPQNVGIVQGRVDPLWPDGSPPQIGRLWSDYLSIVQRADDGDMTANPLCAGANMLVNKSAWAQIGGYSTAVGRVGSNLASGIDTDLVNRVVKQGYKIHYSNRIAVLHKIHEERLTREWIAKRALKEGESQGTTLSRSKADELVLALKLISAIPALHILSALFPKNDDLLVRKHIDLGMFRSLVSKRRDLGDCRKGKSQWG